MQLREFAASPSTFNDYPPRPVVPRAAIALSPIMVSDIAAVRRVECRVYSYPWSRTIFLDCIHSRYECWMMKLGQRVIAYGIMMLGVDAGTLMNLVVDHDFRGQGHASYLLRFLCDIAIRNNKKHMLLEVRASNHSAVKLYRKMGFRQISRRSNYYPTAEDCEDALVLAKWL